MHIKTAARMLSAVAISGAAAQSANGDATTGALGDATPVTNNPSGAQYVATLPDTAFDKAAFPNGGNVNGSIQAVSMPDGHGVMFHVSFSNLPDSGGPFIYHIHDQPVPADGNCTATLGHLDPFQRGEATPCDASRPQACQVGDLSGKHGSANATGDARAFAATYADDYASTLGGIGAFFGNRSFVLHFANATRITCANFAAAAPAAPASPSCGGGGNGTSTSSTGTGTSTSSTGTGTATSESTSRATTTRPTGAPATTTTDRPTETATSTSSASPTFVTAAAQARAAPVRELVAGAAALAFLL